MEGVIRAIVDEDSFALVEVARVEWLTFAIEGPERFMKEYRKYADPRHVRSHLDHVPAIDEEGHKVEYRPIVERAVAEGFDSVMIDGSALPLEQNIAVTREIVTLAHAASLPCEAELGAILRFGVGEVPPYEQLFASRQGFTKVEEAVRFSRDTGCDWLSVSIGNIHGAVSAALRDKPKGESRIDLDHLETLSRATGIPLVLHGGSGIRRSDVIASMKKGIAKINVGFEIRKAYEDALTTKGGVAAGVEATYERTRSLLRDHFGIAGIAGSILGA
jgi:fructose/tagatose bisphosphate aldolase